MESRVCHYGNEKQDIRLSHPRKSCPLTQKFLPEKHVTSLRIAAYIKNLASGNARKAVSQNVPRFGTPIALLILVLIVSAQLKKPRSNGQRNLNSNLRVFDAFARGLARKVSSIAAPIVLIALAGCGFAGTP